MTTPGEGLVHDADVPPDVADPDEVPTMQERLGPDATPPFPFWANFEARQLDWYGWPEERDPGDPLYRAWYQYVPTSTFDDPVVDAIRSLILMDTMSWPAAARAHPPDDVGFIAPTLDVNVQFHRTAPSSKWLLLEGTSPVGEDGLIGFASKAWSADRRLLASASGQMLCRPTRR